MPKLDRSYYGVATKDQSLAWLQHNSKTLNGLISFGKTSANSSQTSPDQANVQMWKATGTTPAGANTEFAITHNLMWVPWFYFYILSKDGNIYQRANTGTAWTAATSGALGSIFVKCSVASADYTVIII